MGRLKRRKTSTSSCAGGQPREHSWLSNEEGYATADMESDQLHVPAKHGDPCSNRFCLVSFFDQAVASSIQGYSRNSSNLDKAHMCNSSCPSVCGTSQKT